jgi:CRP/FNR family cyclic AMP-dependent transcriptional regulator
MTAGSDNTGLARLRDDDRRRLLELARRRKFKRGEVVFHEGDPGDSLYLIDKGHAAIRVTTALGDVATLVVLGPGEAFGEGALLAADARRTASAVAVESLEARSVQRSDFEALRAGHPSINQFLIDVLAAQVRRLSAHLVEALYVNVDARVMRRVQALAALYADGSPTVTIPLTQDDIATMAGTTRPTANRVLKAAEDDGIVLLARGRVEVLDEARLARKAR